MRVGAALYGYRVQPFLHEFGWVAQVERDEVPGLSRDVPDTITEIHEGWRAFEAAFDSLRGRHMFGLVYPAQGIYRLFSQRLNRDADNPLGLDETVILAGRYLRLRLLGDPPAIYARIGPAFDALLELAEPDPGRPLVEYYRREGQVDCLLPLAGQR